MMGRSTPVEPEGYHEASRHGQGEEHARGTEGGGCLWMPDATTRSMTDRWHRRKGYEIRPASRQTQGYAGSAHEVESGGVFRTDHLMPFGVIDTMAQLCHDSRGRQANMTRPMESTTRRPRISIDVQPEIRRRLRLAAAKRDLTVRRYVLEAIEERLREDLGDDGAGLLGLTAKADPVLADLWNNRKDAEYDRL